MDDIDAEYELLTARHAIADATGYRMQDGRAWAPCRDTPAANPSKRNTQNPQSPHTE